MLKVNGLLKGSGGIQVNRLRHSGKYDADTRSRGLARVTYYSDSWTQRDQTIQTRPIRLILNRPITKSSKKS